MKYCLNKKINKKGWIIMSTLLCVISVTELVAQGPTVWSTWFSTAWAKVSTHTHAHTCTHTHVHTHTRTHMYTHTHTRTHMYTHTCTHMYTHTHPHTHICTHTHTHTHTALISLDLKCLPVSVICNLEFNVIFLLKIAFLNLCLYRKI